MVMEARARITFQFLFLGMISGGVGSGGSMRICYSVFIFDLTTDFALEQGGFYDSTQDFSGGSGSYNAFGLWSETAGD
jgi:hypothetical protein